MKIEIELKTDNHAFIEDKEQEIKRILQETIKKIVSGIDKGGLRDCNGNIVGKFTVRE